MRHPEPTPPSGLKAFMEREQQRREQRHHDQQDARVVVESAEIMRLAERFIDSNYAHESGPLIRRWRGEWWTYDNNVWTAASDEDIEAKVRTFVNTVDVRTISSTGREQLVPLRVGTHTVSATVRALLRDSADKSYGTIVPNIDGPLWLDNRTDPNPMDLILFRNGTLDVNAYVDGRPAFAESDPALFGGSIVPHDYDPEQTHAPQWEAFLRSIWHDDTEQIAMLQQYAGYCLTEWTHHHKMLLAIGPTRAGKGVVTRVLGHMLGKANTTSPSFASLGTDFGLSPLLHKRLAFVHDARLSGRPDTAMIVERLLNLTGEDDVVVNRKFIAAVTTKLRCRIALITNELPKLVDQSAALANRFIILRFTQSFLGKEDIHLTTRLLTECPAIINWALQGLRDLHIAGKFTEAASTASLRSELEDLGSPVGAFVRDCCRLDPTEEVPTKLVFSAYRAWCRENGHHPGTEGGLGRDIRSVIPNLERVGRMEQGDRHYVYTGLALTLKAAETARVEEANHSH